MNTKIRNSKKVQRLGVSYLRKDEGAEVYVRNVSHEKDANKQKSDINITVNTSDGQSINVIMPITWIPIDLTNQVPKEDLIRSPNFLTMVNRGFLEIVTKDDAMDILNDEDAQEEIENVMNKIANLGNLLPDGEHALTEIEKQSEGVTEEQTRIHPLILETLAREDLEESQMYSIFKNQEAAFKEEDLEYVLTKSDSERIKRWATERLKKA